MSKVLCRVPHVLLHLVVALGVLRQLLLEERSLGQQLLVLLPRLQQLRVQLQPLLGEVRAHLRALHLGLGHLGVVQLGLKVERTGIHSRNLGLF